MKNNGNRLPIIEALILSSSEPLQPGKIAELLDNTTPADIDLSVAGLNEKYHSNDMSFRIRKIAGGYQMFVIEEYAGFVREFYTQTRRLRLSRAALETVAIIAYRQPVTRTNIELIRGVASDSAIHTLMERKLITLAGRANSVGRPLLYRTTNDFLRLFGLNSLEDLPKMKEIEEILSSGEPDNQQSLFINSDDASPKSETETETETENNMENNKPSVKDIEKIETGKTEPFPKEISAEAEKRFDNLVEFYRNGRNKQETEEAIESP